MVLGISGPAGTFRAAPSSLPGPAARREPLVLPGLPALPEPPVLPGPPGLPGLAAFRPSGPVPSPRAPAGRRPRPACGPRSRPVPSERGGRLPSAPGPAGRAGPPARSASSRPLGAVRGRAGPPVRPVPPRVAPDRPGPAPRSAPPGPEWPRPVSPDRARLASFLPSPGLPRPEPVPLRPVPAPPPPEPARPPPGPARPRPEPPVGRPGRPEPSAGRPEPAAGPPGRPSVLAGPRGRPELPDRPGLLACPEPLDRPELLARPELRPGAPPRPPPPRPEAPPRLVPPLRRRGSCPITLHLPGLSAGPTPSQHAGSQQKTGGRFGEAAPREVVRRRPTLPRGPPRSTIGAEGLNFRVRNGTGCFPFAMATETLWRCGARPHLGNRTVDACTRVWESPPRPGVVEAKPLGLLVPVSSTRCHASTSGLSTQSSSWGPYRVNPEGDLILRRASRLDAFSGYPFRT